MTGHLIAEDVVIVLADLQPPMVAHSRTNSEASLRRASGVLVEGAQALGIPVLRSVIRGGSDRAPEVIAEAAGEPTIVRTTVSVLDHEESRNALLAPGRSTIAIGGVSTEVAVLHAALTARGLGHPVLVLVDVCGSRSDRAEQAALRQMEAAGATLSSVASLLTGLVPNLDSPEFASVLGLLGRLWAD